MSNVPTNTCFQKLVSDDIQKDFFQLVRYSDSAVLLWIDSDGVIHPSQPDVDSGGAGTPGGVQYDIQTNNGSGGFAGANGWQIGAQGFGTLQGLGASGQTISVFTGAVDAPGFTFSTNAFGEACSLLASGTGHTSTFTMKDGLSDEMQIVVNNHAAQLVLVDNDSGQVVLKAQTGHGVLTLIDGGGTTFTLSTQTLTATTANAGSNGAVPAQVDGYLIVTIGGVVKKLPYFAT